MLGNFWQGAGGSVAEKLTREGVSRLFGSATLFWGVGVAAWLSAHGGLATVLDIYGKLKVEQYVVDLIAFGVSLYFLLTLSQLVMEWFTLPLLRFVEGYWVWPLNKLVALWVKYWVKWRWQRKDARWNSLDRLATTPSGLNPSEQAEYYRLEDDLLANYPKNHNSFMPGRQHIARGRGIFKCTLRPGGHHRLASPVASYARIGTTGIRSRPPEP